MRGLSQDVRHALRLFARTPGFAITAILVLAVGIGANTAIFTVTNAFLYEPLGDPASGELVGIYLREKGPEGGYRPFSYAEYRDLVSAAGLHREAGGAPVSAAFTSLMAQEMVAVGLGEGTVTRRSWACLVSADYFPTMGVVLAAGRPFSAGDGESPAQPGVVVSHAFWKRSGRGSLAGETATINGKAFPILGVAPDGFTGTTALVSPEVWLPIGARPLLNAGDGDERAAAPGEDGRTLSVVGRLRPGLDREAALPLITAISARFQEARKGGNEDVEITAGSLSRFALSAGPRTDTEAAAVLFFVWAMATVVLVIACLNLANMFLAMGGARDREIATRLALGAGRGRIVRQVLTESMLLSSAGAALGLLVSTGATWLLARAVTAVSPFPIVFEPSPGVRALAITAAIAAATALAFGLAPALRMAGLDLVPRLKGAAGRPGPRARPVRATSALVVGQLALSLALLAAAGLFVRGALAARDADPGFPLEAGLVASTDASLAGHGDIGGRQAYAAMLSRLRALPGVASASLASSVPFGIDGSYGPVRRAGAGESAESWGGTVVVGSGYFETVGLPVLRGRDFSEAEERGDSTARPVIVDAAMAKRLWPGSDPLGQQVQLGSGSPGGGWAEPSEVVGIVAAVRDSLFDEEPGAHVYLPFGSGYRSAMNVHVKLASKGEEGERAMASAVRREIAAGAMPVLSLKSLREHRDASLYMWIARASAQVFAVFGISALLLAVLGVYGVKAYLVSRRTREIGIRIALGATRLDVVRLVVRDGMWLTLTGLAAGLALAVALSRILQSWVYGVTGIEPAVVFGAALLLAGAAFAASYVPARRAVRLPPATALRAE